ncbi:MAG: nucleotidyltransferase substrate binding protein [Deltaproteobacteria bacterium]|nr:nucleotidyltransferase substrate binding protein [Deltaproteobacteria bacterium]
MTRLDLRLDLLGQALSRLREALAVPADAPLAVDGTIQRFEFAYELFWKTLKAVLLEVGVDTATPRDALVEAFAAGWLEDDRMAVRMLQARNLTLHTYDEALARDVYAEVPAFLALMDRAVASIRHRLAKTTAGEP